MNALYSILLTHFIKTYYSFTDGVAPPSISPDLYANTLTKKIALDNGSATVSKDAALTTTYEICFPHSYLPSDGEGLGSVGRSGHFKRGPLWHLLLRVHHHGLTRAGAKIHMRRNWLS